MDDAGSAYSLSRLIGYLLIGVVAALATALVQQRRNRPGLVLPLVVGSVVTVAALVTSVLGNGEEPAIAALLQR